MNLGVSRRYIQGAALPPVSACRGAIPLLTGSLIGVIGMDEVILKERITALRTGCDRAQTALERVKVGARPTIEINPMLVERFGQTMREKLTTGDAPFRKAYLGAIVDRIEVDDYVVRIVGRKDVLEQAVLANGGPVPGVRSFVRKWRSLGESNPSFQIEN